MPQYRCPALGDCERANSGEVFDQVAGEAPHCPSCNAVLETVGPPAAVASAPPRKKPLALLGGVAAVVVLAGVAAVALKPGGADAAFTSPAATSVATAGASAPAAPAKGLAPAEALVAQQKADGQAQLENGDAKAAAAASSKAAANEMVKNGISKLAQGQLDDAEKAFKSALDIDPKQSLAYYNIGIVRMRQARADDALRSFEAAFMAGFDDYYSAMDRDPDLVPLRQDQRFAELVARYRK